MNRKELEDAIRFATEITLQNEVLVIGSQSILASFDDDELPAEATRSIEVDIAPLKDDEQETISTFLEAKAGEWSPFHAEHGFYIQGVGRRTAILPDGRPQRDGFAVDQAMRDRLTSWTQAG